METRQDGFSLVELMVAMLVTMVISGAVFGLMAAGQGAFRREPALTDRQQNIRVAMDIIQRDVQNGGAGMDPWEQVFTLGDGLGETAPFLNAAGPNVPTPTGERSDFLQIIGTIDCPAVPVVQIGGGANFQATIGFPSCYPEPGMVAITFASPNPGTVWGLAFNAHAGQTQFNFPNGQQPPKSEINTPGSLNGGSGVVPIQLVRYEIAPEPADGVPGLWRSRMGGIDPDSGNYVPAPGIAVPRAGWELVARGIEDMQVRYAPGNGVYADGPPIVVTGNFPTLTRSVEITLWARAIGIQLQGQTVPAGSSPGLGAAVRGSLVSVITPRQALMTLRDPLAPAGYQWR